VSHARPCTGTACFYVQSTFFLTLRDGIDPDCAQDVLIERVFISTGDDNIAIKSGRNWFGRTYGRPSQNITVKDSIFGTGHGISIGSEMSGGVYNVLFQVILVARTALASRNSDVVWPTFRPPAPYTEYYC
jgi:polygalacturonase